ncbi:hypothetical protein [Streptomyces griseicoloratus]|uniref:hypothetical protein n=1 Tax=Streptomyces griseicoloratus TaxID=2752516 RepID=UPI001CB7237B|nr:hypothetical protein [Streptomyces griseicoloratus]
MTPSPLPDHTSVLGEVRDVRRAGLLRLRALELPSLTRLAAARFPGSAGEARIAAVERLLRLAVARLGGGVLQEAAEYSLGLAPGTRDWPPADRRRRAAEIYGVSVERFRKSAELRVLGDVAEQVLRLAGEAAPPSSPWEAGSVPPDAAPATTGEAGPAPAWDAASVVPGLPALSPLAGRAAVPPAPRSPGGPAPRRTHRVLRLSVAGRPVAVTLHVHPVDLLRDVDVVVSPSNVYFALPEPYKASVSASLRRAGALRGPTGELIEDRIHDELRGWLARHGAAHRPVLTGTVVPTDSGALRGQGVRRIYHAAVAVPRPGTNDYDVLPADVTRAAARALALLGEESDRFDPPLTSVCFPLLGSGRGGLPHAASIAAVWAAVEAEWARGARWEIHLVVRAPSRAQLVERLLGGGEHGGTGRGHRHGRGDEGGRVGGARGGDDAIRAGDALSPRRHP